MTAGIPRDGGGLRARKPLELLMTLVAAGERGLAHGVLCDLLWPDAAGDAAYRALVTTAYRLRRLLHCQAAVSFAGGRVTLDSAHCWVDAWAFEQALPACPRRSADAVDGALAAALALYHGPLFGDAELPQVFQARDRLRRKFVRGVLAAGQRYAQDDNLEAAIGLYEQAVDADGGCEELLRALIVATASIGDMRATTSAYERCQSFLMTRFGMLPTVATERAWRESRGLHAGPRSLAYAAASLPGA